MFKLIEKIPIIALIYLILIIGLTMASILVIDDSKFQCKIISKMLTELGHSPQVADDGNHGLELIKTNDYDCVTLDLLMPEPDGFQILQKIRESGNNIPVVIISADIQESSKERCNELGANAFLNKPPSKAELGMTLNNIIKG